MNKAYQKNSVGLDVLSSIESTKGKALFILIVIGDHHGLGISECPGPSFLRCPDDGFHRHLSNMVFENILPQRIPISDYNPGNAHQHISGERIVFSLPCSHGKPQRRIQRCLSVFVKDPLQRGYGADGIGLLGIGYRKTIRPCHRLNHHLFLIACLNMCLEGLIGDEAFDVLLLVSKDVGFFDILKVIIDHAPHRRIPGTGSAGHALYGMLSVKNEIDAIPPADFHRVDLINVKLRKRLFYVSK